MRRVCRLVLAGMMAVGFASCGSTGNENALVIPFQGFSGNSGGTGTGSAISECDQVGPTLAEVDLVLDCCETDSTTGECTKIEPFTETAVNALFGNNQKLDITLDRYSVTIRKPDGSLSFNLVDHGQISGIVRGKRCASDASRACAVDNDCVIGGAASTCTSTQSTVQTLVFSFDAKNQIVKNIGRESVFDVFVTYFGHDDAEENWQADGRMQVSFADFDNCSCSLTR